LGREAIVKKKGCRRGREKGQERKSSSERRAKSE
jgi:hypothetical protein